MKRWPLVCVSLLAMMLIAGCGDESTVTDLNVETNVNGRVIGMIHGVVTDAANGALVPNVVVWTAVEGRIVSTTTNEEGYYALTNLPSGYYVLTFDFREAGKALASAYAVGRTSEEIPLLEDIGISEYPNTRDFPYSVTHDMTIYPLTAGLTGRVFKEPDDEHRDPAAGVTVVADFGWAGYQLAENEYTTTTDASGTFLLTNLPATEEVYVRTLPFSDTEHDFSWDGVWADLTAGATEMADNITVGLAGDGPVVVANNFGNGNFDINGTLTLTFSDNMQPDPFYIELYGPYGLVPADISWTNPLTLVVDPLVPLQPDASYHLNLEGQSERGLWIDTTIWFGTAPGLEFLSTNLEIRDGEYVEFPVDGDIEMTYTQAVDLANVGTNITLVLPDLSGDPPVAITYSLSADEHTVIIHPVHRLEPYTHYQLDITVVGYLGEYAGDTFHFYTAKDATLPVTVTGFQLDMPAGWHADWTTTSMTFRWNTQPKVTGYHLYARDTAAKTDFVLVKTVTANEAVYYQTTTVNLATSPFNTIFDVYEGDGIQTPFTAGRQVVFQIAAYNDAGESTLSSAVTIGDETPPTGSLGSQSGTANNTAGSEPDTITVHLTASEYLNFSRPPVWEMQEAGGDPAYHLPAGALSFKWDADVKGGTVTLIIPTGKDASGDRLTLDDEFEDSSGNEVDTSVDLILF